MFLDAVTAERRGRRIEANMLNMRTSLLKTYSQIVAVQFDNLI